MFVLIDNSRFQLTCRKTLTFGVANSIPPNLDDQFKCLSTPGCHLTFAYAMHWYKKYRTREILWLKRLLVEANYLSMNTIRSNGSWSSGGGVGSPAPAILNTSLRYWLIVGEFFRGNIKRICKKNIIISQNIITTERNVCSLKFCLSR